jgi:DNA-binding NarL/FixJ family response regulator
MSRLAEAQNPAMPARPLIPSSNPGCNRGGTASEITILIAEDDGLLRNILSNILSEHQGFKVLDKVASGTEVVPAVKSLRPDVLLLDLMLGKTSGLTILSNLAEMASPPRTLVLTGDESEMTQLEAARRGAAGYLCKPEALECLPKAIRAISDGKYWFPNEIMSLVLQDYATLARRARAADQPASVLTEREVEVLVRIARGHTDPQIAAELYMSVSTAKTHIRSILEKLKLPNRTAAAVFAAREGLLDQMEAKEE